MRCLLSTLLASVVCFVGCGGAAPSPEDPSTEDEQAKPDEPDPAETEPGGRGGEEGSDPSEAAGLPTQCADSGTEHCTPGKKFATRLCQGDFPTVALHMFSGNSPFTKAYLGRKTKAWSASGAGSSNEELPRDEEVVIVMHRAPKDLGGMTVSGATGGFEALRWNGGCVTLQAGEVLFNPPPRPKIARIVWKRLEMDTRDALREDSSVNEAYLEHRKHCKGVSMGEVSLKCVKADGKLGEAVAKFVRDGGKLVTPNKRP